MMNGGLAGLVLAGGQAIRFGSEKALAELGGKTLLARAAASLKTLTPRVAVSVIEKSGTEAAARSLGFPVLHDPASVAQGPLLGVLSGLEWARSCGDAWLLTLPCDTVLASSEALTRLVDASNGAGPAYVVTKRGIESLCALWPVAGANVLRQALAGGHPPVRDILHALGATAVPIDGENVFLNINTPDDLARVETILATVKR